MRWEFGCQSTNVEDRRGTGISDPVVGGGIGAIILSLVVALLGGDPSVIWQQGETPSDRPNTESSQTQRSAADSRMTDFVSVVLADTEDTWHSLFRQMGETYVERKLFLYKDAVESACGFGRSAVL